MDRNEAIATVDRVIGNRGFAFSVDIDTEGERAVAAVGTDDPESPELWLVNLSTEQATMITALEDYPLGAVYWAATTNQGLLSVVLCSCYDNPPDLQVLEVNADTLAVLAFADAEPFADYDRQKLEQARPRDDFVSVDW